MMSCVVSGHRQTTHPHEALYTLGGRALNAMTSQFRFRIWIWMNSRRHWKTNGKMSLEVVAVWSMGGWRVVVWLLAEPTDAG